MDVRACASVAHEYAVQMNVMMRIRGRELNPDSYLFLW
jgi:hypothetical protein